MPPAGAMLPSRVGCPTPAPAVVDGFGDRGGVRERASPPILGFGFRAPASCQPFFRARLTRSFWFATCSDAPPVLNCLAWFAVPRPGAALPVPARPTRHMRLGPQGPPCTPALSHTTHDIARNPGWLARVVAGLPSRLASRPIPSACRLSRGHAQSPATGWVERHKT